MLETGSAEAGVEVVYCQRIEEIDDVELQSRKSERPRTAGDADVYLRSRNSVSILQNTAAVGSDRPNRRQCARRFSAAKVQSAGNIGLGKPCVRNTGGQRVVLCVVVDNWRWASDFVQSARTGDTVRIGDESARSDIVPRGQVIGKFEPVDTGVLVV